MTRVGTNSAGQVKIVLMCVTAITLVFASYSIAQDPPELPFTDTISADAESSETVSPEASAETAAETVTRGIPTDLQGIADAMGRPFSAAFVIASVIGLWCFLERLVMLRRHRVIPRSFVERFFLHLRAGRMDRLEAIAICQQNQSPVSDVLMHGIRKWGRPSVEVEQAVLDGGERQVSQLKKGLRVLNGVSTLCPLIGLLGTVVGMIRAFNDVATAGAIGQTETLANGIALALLTTAAGLFIAIPSMAGYLLLAGRVDSVVMEMDRLGQELVQLISSEGLRDRGIDAPVAPSRQPAMQKQEVPATANEES